MANTTLDIKCEITSLLNSALPQENLKDYDIEIVGTAEKGDGFSGDIYFVKLTSIKKNYNFVLKCSKSSEALRKAIPVKDAYEQEIYIYNTVFPAFRKFEIERNIKDVFDSVPKCYGTCISQEKEVIVLQNLKAVGYELWDKRLPLPRNYLECVLKQYGRWHAISAAMQDQEPKEFEKLTNNMIDAWATFQKAFNFTEVCLSAIKNVEEIWENEMEEHILNEWKQLKDYIGFYLVHLKKKSKSLNVITHGDCWNNNFMYRAIDTGKSKEVEVAIIDWQMSGFSSPVNDVSYFLYSCISEEDLKDFGDLLKVYYTSFSEHLTKLGSNPEKIYTYSNLLDDWKIYGRLGVIFSALVFRVIFLEKDDIPDMAQAAENGEDMTSTFCKTVKNVDFVKQRSRCIIQHAVERELLKPIKHL